MDPFDLHLAAPLFRRSAQDNHRSVRILSHHLAVQPGYALRPAGADRLAGCLLVLDDVRGPALRGGDLFEEYELSKNLKLNNTLFGIRGYGFFDYDGSWAPLSYYRLTPEYGFDVNGDPEQIYVEDLLIRAYVDNKQAGWLPQLQYSHPKGSIIVGAV